MKQFWIFKGHIDKSLEILHIKQNSFVEGKQ